VPVPNAVANRLVRERHYLHSAPSGLRLSLGVFAHGELAGVVQFNAGPRGAHSLFAGASSAEVLSLCRLWLDDRLPKNSESRVLSVGCRLLAKQTPAKAVVSYADPGAGHLGRIYRAAGWLFLGHSEPQPLVALDDGVPRHTRSVSSILHTHSVAYLRRHGFQVRLVPTRPKLPYVKLLDPAWIARLKRKPLPYPREEEQP
jgi:hypothetical protein